MFVGTAGGADRFQFQFLGKTPTYRSVCSSLLNIYETLANCRYPQQMAHEKTLVPTFEIDRPRLPLAKLVHNPLCTL